MLTSEIQYLARQGSVHFQSMSQVDAKPVLNFADRPEYIPDKAFYENLL
jgi:hypothetical protein